MNSVVYVSHDALTEGIGMSQIRPLVKGLADKGWNVTLISMEKRQPSQEIRSELSQANVNWIPLSFGERGFIHGILRVLKLIRILPNADVYHCRGDLASLSVVSRFKRNYLWDVRGLWGEQKMVIGSAPDNALFRKIFIGIEKLVASRASAVTTLANALFPILEKRTGSLPTRRDVIPTCVDLELFKFQPKLPQRMTLLLSGVFNDYYDIDQMQKIIPMLSSALNLKVIWCRGDESDRNDLGIGEIEIYSRKQNEMPLEIANASIGMAICKVSAGVSLAGVMPTKVAEFLSTGRPVIISPGMGDLDKIVSTHNVGVVVESALDENELVSQVKALLKDPEMPNRCRNVAEEYFNMRNAISKYEVLYRGIIEDNEKNSRNSTSELA